MHRTDSRTPEGEGVNKPGQVSRHSEQGTCLAWVSNPRLSQEMRQVCRGPDVQVGQLGGARFSGGHSSLCLPLWTVVAPPADGGHTYSLHWLCGLRHCLAAPISAGRSL